MQSEDDLFRTPSRRERAWRWIAGLVKSVVLCGAIIGGIFLLAKGLHAIPGGVDVLTVILGVGSLALLTLFVGFPIHYNVAPKRIQYGLEQPDLFGSRRGRLVALAVYAPIAVGLVLVVLWRAGRL